MTNQLSETSIVRAVAERAGQRITRKVVLALQKMNVMCFGDDYGLQTTWDEVCVQVQFQYSAYWDAYEETIHALVEGHVNELAKHEVKAIWLQTNDGRDWICELPEEREDYPVLTEQVVDHIIQEYVYNKGANWSNERIRRYLDRACYSD